MNEEHEKRLNAAMGAMDAKTSAFTGLILRDYFAAQALIRLTGADPEGVHSAQTLAMLCYRLADAMLAERSKERPE